MGADGRRPVAPHLGTHGCTAGMCKRATHPAAVAGLARTDGGDARSSMLLRSQGGRGSWARLGPASLRRRSTCGSGPRNPSAVPPRPGLALSIARMHARTHVRTLKWHRTACWWAGKAGLGPQSFDLQACFCPDGRTGASALPGRHSFAGCRCARSRHKDLENGRVKEAAPRVGNAAAYRLGILGRFHGLTERTGYQAVWDEASARMVPALADMSWPAILSLAR